MQRLSGAPLAEPSPAVLAAMRSKFPGRPPHQATSSRPAAPPANEAGVEDVVRAIRSFPRGAAPGPTGLRPDLLQQLVSGSEERPAAHLLTQLVNLLADGQAPAGLRPYVGGGRGTALQKVSKTGTADVRPLCAGEALRRLVGKVLLRSELPALRAHLLPHQLAVGVSSGAEAMVHLHRQWVQRHSHDADRVCLSYDEGNAHNAVDRHCFLTRMREVVPGLGRWLEYIYPTNVATKVFFHDQIIESVAGGQQGCPLMMACHAVVQRLLLESLGLVPPLEGSSIQLPVLSPPARLDIAPCFADDGLLAGPSAEVLRCLRHWQGVLPQLGLRLSSAVVAPAVAQDPIDYTGFVTLGCTVEAHGNYEVLRSPTGADSFCVAYCKERAAKQVDIVRRVGQLEDPQVGYYLLRFSCGAGRMTYMARTTPARLCRDGLLAFDSGVQASFTELTGFHPDALAWEQATLPVQLGGLGLRPAAGIADAAYIGSRAATFERCNALWPCFQWDSNLGSDLSVALQHCWDQLRTPVLPVPFQWDDHTTLTQTHLSSLVSKTLLDGWYSRAGSDDACRLHAYAVDGSAAALGFTPSHTLDTTLSRSDFLAILGGRLGVDVCGGGPCRFCGKPSDCKGRHALSCMAGGDHVALHNSLRDLVFDYCQRAQVRPVLEAPGLLNGQRRPADVLVRSATGLVPRLPDGAQPHNPPPLALDIAVVNALGDTHWDATRQAAGAACLAYAQRKRAHNRTAGLCEAAGVRYLPLVWEVQGGSTPETRAFVHRLCGAVAVVEGLDPGVVKSRFSEQVAVLLARASGRAIRRRQAVVGDRAGLPLDLGAALALDP